MTTPVLDDGRSYVDGHLNRDDQQQSRWMDDTLAPDRIGEPAAALFDVAIGQDAPAHRSTATQSADTAQPLRVA